MALRKLDAILTKRGTELGTAHVHGNILLLGRLHVQYLTGNLDTTVGSMLYNLETPPNNHIAER